MCVVQLLTVQLAQNPYRKVCIFKRSVGLNPSNKVIHIIYNILLKTKSKGHWSASKTLLKVFVRAIWEGKKKISIPQHLF